MAELGVSHEWKPTQAPSAKKNKKKPPRAKTKIRPYSVGEEIGNAVTHGIGALLSIAAIVLCAVKGAIDGGGVLVFSAVVYSVFMFLEYLMSTLYHAMQVDKAKKVFKVLDHSFIYLFIAGSYTPYCLITLSGTCGYPLCAFVWIVAIIGVALEAFWVFRPKWISSVIYVLLGWAVVWFIPDLFTLLDPAGFWLLLAGGICYTAGAVIYAVFKNVPFMHMVFHIFILAGSILQFLSIVLFVL